MKELEFSVQDMKELMAAFAEYDMGSLKIKQGDTTLHLESRKVEQVMMAAPMMAAPMAAPAVIGAAEPAQPAGPVTPAGREVKSPIVGTFYAAAGPDKEPFVRCGSKVKKGDVLFIIESMKLMNEVTSEHDGTVSCIVVENAQGVEYGQPILYIE